MFGIKKTMMALLLTGSMTLGAGLASADPGTLAGKGDPSGEVTVKTTSKDGQEVVVHTDGALTRVFVNGELLDEILAEDGEPGTSIAGPLGQVIRWAIGIALDLVKDGGSSSGGGSGTDGSGTGDGNGNTGSGNGAGNSGSGTCNNNINNTGGGTVIVIAPCGPA